MIKSLLWSSHGLHQILYRVNTFEMRRNFASLMKNKTPLLSSMTDPSLPSSRHQSPSCLSTSCSLTFPSPVHPSLSYHACQYYILSLNPGDGLNRKPLKADHSDMLLCFDYGIVYGPRSSLWMRTQRPPSKPHGDRDTRMGIYRHVNNSYRATKHNAFSGRAFGGCSRQVSSPKRRWPPPLGKCSGDERVPQGPKPQTRTGPPRGMSAVHPAWAVFPTPAGPFPRRRWPIPPAGIISWVSAGFSPRGVAFSRRPISPAEIVTWRRALLPSPGAQISARRLKGTGVRIWERVSHRERPKSRRRGG